MTPPRDETQTDRIEELLVQRATEGLSAAEAAELSALGAAEDLSFDLAVAALYVAMPQPQSALPPHLFDRIVSSATVGSAVAKITDAPRRRRREAVAWATAAIGFAAAVAIALWSSTRPAEVQERPVATPQVASIDAERLRLLEAPDTQAIAWTATKDPAGERVTGDVVWSPSRQEGFMKFEGLAANDPARAQYQLWIFDKNRDDKFPVDGGVFNIGAKGEAIVRITPKLPVSEAVLFAVSIEPPGGVVVSKRERIVATAAPSG